MNREKKEFGFIPQTGDTYYFTRLMAMRKVYEVQCDKWTGSLFGMARLANANVFRTSEEAQEYADAMNLRLSKVCTLYI